MSVTIRDMLKLPVFNNAKVVAGYDGLDSVIMSVSVLESADEESLGIIFPGVSSNYNHEVSIAAMMEARNDVQKQIDIIKKMKIEGQVGLILYYVGYVLPEVNQKVIDYANNISMPLIVMPSNLELRYSDAIIEIMEAIIEDKRESDYFASDIIELLSKLSPENRTVNSVLSIIRERTQSSIFLYDDTGRELNRIEWPRDRNLPAKNLVDIIQNKGFHDGDVNEVIIDGSPFSICKSQFNVAFSSLDAIVLKERGSLTVDECEQIRHILQTYINLWAEEYGSVDTKQLISSIIHDEPEKMHRLAKSMKLDVSALSSVYYIYFADSNVSVNRLSDLRKAKKIISNALVEYSNKYVIDTFDQVLVILAYRKRELIDGDLPILLELLEKEGVRYNAVICNPTLTARMVKESYWLLQHNIEAAHIVFPYKRVLNIGEIDFVDRIRRKNETDEAPSFVYKDICELLINNRKDSDLIDTLATLLLDADMNVTRAAEIMKFHKSTIKYRIKCIEEILGHRINKMPELNDLYEIAGLYRLDKH